MADLRGYEAAPRSNLNGEGKMRSRQPAGRRRYSRFSAACKTQCLLAIVGTAAVPFPTRVDRTGREFSGLTWNPSITLGAGCQHYGNEREKAAAHFTGSVPRSARALLILRPR